MTTRISKILRASTRVIRVGPKTTVLEAVGVMMTQNVASVIVLDENEKLIGIFTERDLLRRVVAPGLDPATIHIEKVMTDRVHTVDQNATSEEVRALMENHHIRHVPVVVDGAVMDVISLRDILRCENEDKTFEIDQLMGYVSNKPYPRYPA